jgi:hypothetical protein
VKPFRHSKTVTAGAKFRRVVRQTHDGREFTKADLKPILKEEFGITPDAEGKYYRSQFEPLWKQMEKPQ